LNLDEQHGAPYVRSTLEEVTLHTRVIVLGSPGSGKTTLLKGIALELASQEKPGRSILSPTLSSKVPLYLSSADSQFLSSSELEARARLAFDAIAGKSDGRLFKSLLRNGELLLLLDGLDEAPQKLQRGVIAELLKFVEKYPMCHVVAATRPLDYDASLLNAWPRYELQPLDEIEQSEFVKALLQDPRKATAMLEMLRRNPQLETMAASPLTLLVMAVVFQSHADIPRSNFALLSIFTEELISQELRRGRVGREDASVSRITHLLLPELGWDLQKRNLVAISQSELVRLVTSILSGYSLESTTAEAFVRNVRSYVGVFLAISIDADGREMYGFIHRSIQEYFAATYLARQWQRVGARILAEISQEPQWPSVIALASGGFGPREASRFVREILGGKHSDCQNVLLAGECILAGAEVDPELRQHVASQLFTSVAEGNLRLDQMVLTTHLLSELVRSDWPTMRTVLRAALKQGKPDLRLAAMQILATSPLPDWANSEAALIATPLTRDPDDRISLYASEVINRSERSGSPSKFGV
jgi:energy-coupling factor transporter ATP-binding protein EcfA2